MTGVRGRDLGVLSAASVGHVVGGAASHRRTRRRRRMPSSTPSLLSDATQSTKRVFKRLTEFQRHDVVDDGINDCADIIKDTGHVEEDDLSKARCRVHLSHERRHQSLDMERSPTHEEGNDHSH